MIGVYAITNEVTGQRYIGRSVQMPHRISQHFSHLRRGDHCNRHLQASFKKYGRRAFTGKPLVICRRADAPLYERLLIEGYRSDVRATGFNLTIATDGRLTHTPEARAAIAHYNRTSKPKYERTPEIRAKIAAALTGKIGPNKGRKFSPEHRENLANAKRQMWADPARSETTRAGHRRRWNRERGGQNGND